MATLGIMFTGSTYGTWLRGDARRWVDDGVVFSPDPELERADRGRLKFPPFYFQRELRLEVGQAIGKSLISRMGIVVLALCVQSWHAHFVTAATPHDVADIVKCAKDAVRWKLRLDRPIWATDYDKRFCFDPSSVRSRIAYVDGTTFRTGFRVGRGHLSAIGMNHRFVHLARGDSPRGLLEGLLGELPGV